MARFLALLFLMVLVTLAAVEAKPKDKCHTKGQMIDDECLGFYICRGADQEPQFYPCTNGTLYNLEKKRCQENYICPYQ